MFMFKSDRAAAPLCPCLCTLLTSHPPPRVQVSHSFWPLMKGAPNKIKTPKQQTKEMTL